MIERKNLVMFAGPLLAVSLLASSFTAYFLSDYYNRLHMRILEDICGEILEKEPAAGPAILSALKEYRFEPDPPAEQNMIRDWGYGEMGFPQPVRKAVGLFAAAGALAGGAVFLLTLLLWHKRNVIRIRRLTAHLETVNAGGAGSLFAGGEDEFSRLSDEIDKTVTELYRTRDAALAAKNNFAENLSNIAHQIQTPLTSASLSAQMLYEKSPSEYLDKICYQLGRLTHLAKELLLLSRIDAGTLPLEKKETDVFTLLSLAADNLDELFFGAGVFVRIPEGKPAAIRIDPDWTMEALMNLMKNCTEHTPRGGSVCCSYEQNPVYTQIKIWDGGAGFAKEDLPHLFERFYRGGNAAGGGIGIGLALSKAIIESQNGTVGACNLPEGGACFEIRMYR